MRQSVFRRRGPPRSLPVLAVVWASILVASPNALQRDVDDATAFKTHFLHFSDWSFLGPLDRDLRRECGCVSDALGLLPSFFPDPAGGEGPGSALRPSEAYPREHGRDYVRNLLSGERQGGTPVRELLAGRGEPFDGWMFGRMLLGSPHLLAIDQDIGLKLAVHHLRRAAQTDIEGAQAELGYLYLVGWGVPQSDAHAAYWFDRAARAGLVSAQLAIGAMHALGRGVERSERTAIAWFRRADQARWLGDAYACGFGVPEDLARAKTLYERVPYDAEAQVRLASMHTNGCGAAIDDAKALQLYEAAAQRGHPVAQVALAELHLRTSKEGPPNPQWGYMWAELAYVRLADGALRGRAAEVRAAAAPLVSAEGKHHAVEMVKALKEASEPQRPGSR